MMTTNGCTAATGLVSANGSNNNYFVVGCTGNGGDMCDTATVTDLDSPFTQDGLCLADKSCDGSDVVNHTNVYYGSCDGYGGVQCETTPTSGTWSQDGMCFDDGGASDGTNFDCLTSGYIFWNLSHFEDDGAVAAVDYDYDEDNSGDSCDLSLTTGGNYSPSGMVTSAGCSALGTEVHVDASDNNYFAEDCDASGDLCNGSIVADFNAPWVQEGLCAANNCDAVDVVNNSGTFLANCNDGGGMECEADASSGEFAQSGMCFDDGGGSDGTNFDCEVAGIILYNDSHYIDDSQNGTNDYDYDIDNDARSCDSAITSGGNYSADGIMLAGGVCVATGGIVSVNVTNNNYFVAGCNVTGGDLCDSASSNSLDSPWGQTGLCLNDKSCDGTDVVNQSHVFYGTCATHESYQCEADASSGYFEQSGTCADEGCDTAGHTCNDDGTYYSACSSCDTDWDDDNSGDDCDLDATAGGDYSAAGMCTTGNTCTASGTIIRVDQSAGNVFDTPCDSSGDICDGNGGTSFTQTGLCAESDCDAADVVNNSGTFQVDCDGYGGMECEADASSGSFAQSGMCFDDGGNSDGTNFDCEVAGIIIFNAQRRPKL